ncbi:uncharacterized protein CLUP02_13635 [Colletotrichum lupini]|uniref:Uncharacterized protein n=1 Tax=Colletotrichum lupini TaxID=145971 RepID=A0A9Q8T3A2_9PEZI|nr:uncharacterized protein CLUP02_13635 [Colletotrichum lupini]UQC88113.1 hypothetical protein CLUP02_13635 [Colletotrichum lupini]
MIPASQAGSCNLLLSPVQRSVVAFRGRREEEEFSALDMGRKRCGMWRISGNVDDSCGIAFPLATSKLATINGTFAALRLVWTCMDGFELITGTTAEVIRNLHGRPDGVKSIMVIYVTWRKDNQVNREFGVPLNPRDYNMYL